MVSLEKLNLLCSGDGRHGERESCTSDGGIKPLA